MCVYLSKKPTGATVAEARKVLDPNHLDGRKQSALKTWGLIEEEGGRLKVTPEGRAFCSGDKAGRQKVLSRVIARIGPYLAIIERAAHRHETSLSARDVAAHWHEYFKSEVADTDKILNDQAVCFFQLAAGAGLGEVTVGRHGMPTRFEFDGNTLSRFSFDGVAIELQSDEPETGVLQNGGGDGRLPEPTTPTAKDPVVSGKPLGQAIFIAHGKNKTPLEQLKQILEQFKIPYRIATEEPNLGRPIGSKVRR